jgi:hypothetical protein
MRSTWGSLFVTVLSLITIAAPAMAEAQSADAPPPATSPDGTAPAGSVAAAGPTHPQRLVSVSISPLHLFLPIVELTGEYRAHDKVGVALIAGAGQYSSSSGGVDIKATAFEAGAQVRYYVVGDFRHGMQLGAELLYLHLSDARISTSGEGLAVGPFLGYKYTADIGFTFDGQLGFEYVGARAMASAGGATATNSGSSYIPLLNLNVGWSF